VRFFVVVDVVVVVVVVVVVDVVVDDDDDDDDDVVVVDVDDDDDDDDVVVVVVVAVVVVVVVVFLVVLVFLFHSFNVLEKHRYLKLLLLSQPWFKDKFDNGKTDLFLDWNHLTSQVLCSIRTSALLITSRRRELPPRSRGCLQRMRRETMSDLFISFSFFLRYLFVYSSCWTYFHD
jgi:hypothetical protein